MQVVMKRFEACSFVTIFWLITLVMQPASFSQTGTLEEGEITSPALEGSHRRPRDQTLVHTSAAKLQNK